MGSESLSFWERHEFLIRRLHSLTGLVPLGAYMIVHLTVNASVLDSANAFQKNVYQIHGLGTLLPLVEWTFIFLPLLFHGILGVFIVATGLPNNSAYPNESNFRYTLQRVSGIIAGVFLLWHVFHMHGWFHEGQLFGFGDWWQAYVANNELLGAQFRPFAATTTAAGAIQMHPVVIALYGIGIAASIFHLVNGVWTAAITWGLTITPEAQHRWGVVCWVLGLGISVIGFSALYGMATVDTREALLIEFAMLESQVESKAIRKEVGEHKGLKAEDFARIPEAEKRELMAKAEEMYEREELIEALRQRLYPEGTAPGTGDNPPAEPPRTNADAAPTQNQQAQANSR